MLIVDTQFWTITRYLHVSYIVIVAVYKTDM